MKGRFYVLDGMDGSGKTMQAKLLVKWLKKSGKKAKFTHEPMRNTKLGRFIEKRIRDKKNPPSKAELLELFTKDREYHLRKEVIPNLKKGIDVVCDRYYYSTMAYQLDEKDWIKYASKFLTPDQTFICDAPAEIAIKRINSSLSKNERRLKQKAIFEKLSFLRILRKRYLKLRKFDEVRIIDADKPIDEIFEKIKLTMIGKKLV